MAMTLQITMHDVGVVVVRATGDYAPDVMHDLTARAKDALTHAASLYVEIARTTIDLTGGIVGAAE